MTFINLIPDDLGVQRLKSDNAQPGATRAVPPVDPYPTQQPGQPAQPPVQARRGKRDHRKNDRRQGDRRQRQEPVLLDTRSGQNRRKSTGRRTEESTDKGPVSLNVTV